MLGGARGKKACVKGVIRFRILLYISISGGYPKVDNVWNSSHRQPSRQGRALAFLGGGGTRFLPSAASQFASGLFAFGGRRYFQVATGFCGC